MFNFFILKYNITKIKQEKMDNTVGIYGFKRLTVLFFVAVLIVANSAMVSAEVNGASPTAANFKVQHGPTDATFTGDMQLSLPVMGVPGRGLSVPISLSYKAGVRVDDEASWVGLGWNLNMGAITRGPVGVIDEMRTDIKFCKVPTPGIPGDCMDDCMSGWLKESEYDVGDGCDDRFSETEVDEYEDCKKTGAPDNYYIAFGAGGGKMFPDAEGNFHMQRWSPWDITYEIDDATITKWTITTEDGTRYIFEDRGITSKAETYHRTCEHSPGGAVDCSVTVDRDEFVNYTSVWPITRILSTDYVDVNGNGPDDADLGSWVKFNYAVYSLESNDWIPSYYKTHDPIEDQSHYMFSHKVNTAPPDTPPELKKDYFRSYWFIKHSMDIPYYVREIITPTHRAKFQTSERDSTYGSLISEKLDADFEMLDSIELKTRDGDYGIGDNELIQKVRFGYATGDDRLAIDREAGSRSEHGKLTLKKVIPVGTSGGELPATEFEYANNPRADSETLDDQDAWGYYTTRNDFGADEASVAWSLTKIKYPSGGYVEYDHESDEYSYEGYNQLEEDDYTYPKYYEGTGTLNTKMGGGIRIKAMKINNGFGIESKYSHEYGPGSVKQDPILKDLDTPRGPLFHFTSLTAHDSRDVGHEWVKASIGTNADADKYGTIKTEFRSLTTGGHEYTLGMPLSTETKSNAGETIQSSGTVYGYPLDNYGYIEYFSDSQETEYLYHGWVTVSSSSATADGVTSETEILEYDSENGLATRVVGNGEIETVTEYLKDYRRNILTKPYSTKLKRYGGDDVSIAYYGYDEHWRPFETTVTGLDGLIITITTSVTYDDYGNVESATDAMDTTSYTRYDPTYHTYPVKSWNDVLGSEDDPVTQIDYNDKWLVESITDNLNDATSSYEYDQYNRLIKAVGPFDTVSSPGAENSYDMTSIPNSITTSTKMDEGRYLVAKAFSDGFGAPLQSQVYNPETGNWIVSNAEYNDIGLVYRAYKPKEIATNGYYYTGTLGTFYSETSYYQDPLMRVKTVTPPGAETYVESIYDPEDPDIIEECGTGNKGVKAIDEKGRMGISCSDKFGYTFKVVDPMDQDTHYNYDKVTGLLKTTTDPSDKIWANAYDSIGRLKVFTHPDLGSVWYDEYDDNGNLLQKTDAKGITINYVYDKLNRNTKIDFPTDGDITYYYDNDCGTADTIKSWGRVCKVEDQTGTTSYKYDVGGKLLEENKDFTFHDGTLTTNYDYYTGGGLKTLTDPDEVVRTYEYNDLGQLGTVKLNGDGIASYDYNVEGTIHSLEFGNGVTTNYDYNARDWLTTINTMGVEPIFQRFYDFEEISGNILDIYKGTSPSGEHLAHFDYDDLDRLIGVDDDESYDDGGDVPGYYHGDMSYSYDEVGNRKTKIEPDVKDPGEFVYHDYLYYDDDYETMLPAEDAGTNRMASDGIHEYGYDENGNTIVKKEIGSRRATIYSYTEGNRLENVSFCNYYDDVEGCTEFDQDKTTNEFIYDAGGRRVRKIDSKGETIYIYDTGLNVIYEIGPDGGEGQCPEGFLKADVFPDGKINTLDLFAVTDHWAEECP